MDFGALPPEINSGRMYSGPGSAPMRAASAAWNLLAAELESTATQYQSTIDVLDDEWRGATTSDDGRRGRPVHPLDEPPRRPSRADRSPGFGRRERLRGGIRDDGPPGRGRD